MAKTGPKPKPAEELRSSRLGLRLLPNELERIGSAARSVGEDVSAFIRRTALQAAALILGVDQQRTSGPETAPSPQPTRER